MSLLAAENLQKAECLHWDFSKAKVKYLLGSVNCQKANIEYRASLPAHSSVNFYKPIIFWYFKGAPISSRPSAWQRSDAWLHAESKVSDFFLNSAKIQNKQKFLCIENRQFLAFAINRRKNRENKQLMQKSSLYKLRQRHGRKKYAFYGIVTSL